MNIPFHHSSPLNPDARYVVSNYNIVDYTNSHQDLSNTQDLPLLIAVDIRFTTMLALLSYSSAPSIALYYISWQHYSNHPLWDIYRYQLYQEH